MLVGLSRAITSSTKSWRDGVKSNRTKTTFALRHVRILQHGYFVAYASVQASSLPGDYLIGSLTCMGLALSTPQQKDGNPAFIYAWSIDMICIDLFNY
jgi:hypothetical protein